MPFAVPLAKVRAVFPYQAIAGRAVFLKRLGMSASAIARCSGVTDKTVTKTIRGGQRSAPRAVSARC